MTFSFRLALFQNRWEQNYVAQTLLSVPAFFISYARTGKSACATQVRYALGYHCFALTADLRSLSFSQVVHTDLTIAAEMPVIILDAATAVVPITKFAPDPLPAAILAHGPQVVTANINVAA